jgi:hypothetical protein
VDVSDGALGWVSCALSGMRLSSFHEAPCFQCPWAEAMILGITDHYSEKMREADVYSYSPYLVPHLECCL